MRLVSTKVFSVYAQEVEEGGRLSYRDANCYKVGGPFSPNLRNRTKRSLERFGFCICPDIIDKELAKRTWSVLNVLVKKLVAAYDSIEDEFVDIDQEEFCITRMPRIGRGKHNIHFDPILSVQHEAVAELASQSLFADILSNYSGKSYSLRESGFSLTRPTLESMENSTASLQRSSLYAGEGMEWHSDGSAGEATVLLSLTGITEDMGPVRVMPRSHKDYVDGTGHSEVS
ncbi:hypothetical protein EON65_00820 [archaeon]|nr:MAG: hypothetical protein EON65_00820 [archaeon]